MTLGRPRRLYIFVYPGRRVIVSVLLEWSVSNMRGYICRCEHPPCPAQFGIFIALGAYQVHCRPNQPTGVLSTVICATRFCVWRQRNAKVVNDLAAID